MYSNSKRKLELEAVPRVKCDYQTDVNEQILLRYYCRYYLVGTVTAADHLMLIALVLSWGNLLVNYDMDETSSHTGPSYYRIPEKRPLMKEYVKGVMITWWIYRKTHVAALGFIEPSILYFFKSFASHRTLRHTVNATVVFVGVYSLGATIAAAFQCRKLSDAWNTDIYFAQFDTTSNPDAPKGQCYDPTMYFMFSDAVTLLLPIPTLLSLNIPLKQRLALVGIFSVGMLAMVASSVRMRVMTLWAASPWNSAIYGTDLLLWGQVETNSGIISASVPFLRLLFKRKERAERLASGRKVVEIGSPRAGRKPQLEPLEMDTIMLCSNAEMDEEKQTGWTPFITVPASLGERSLGSIACPVSPKTMA